MTRPVLATAVAVCIGGAITLAAQAAEIRVTPLVAGGEVSASFVAPAAFTSDAQAVLQSGLLLTFRFTVELRRPMDLWWDRTIRQVTAGSSVKFDTLTGAYHVSRLVDGHIVWSDRTMDLAQAKTWMTTFERVPLVPADGLEPNVDYYIRVHLRATPRRTFSIWPWAADDGAGRADFTNIR
jgi:hypothetical protein